ncbi:MAG: synthetase [Anaerocolumna sp.]|jgi:predicted amidohydrolase|nr:synthetase [Anaerocolumna sp.]
MYSQIYTVAQIKSFRENYTRNIEKHMEYIRLSAQYNSKIVIFPEMSLTGYDRERAGDQCFTKDDLRLECLRKASLDYSIVIVAGAPLLLKGHLYIASWVFTPTNDPQIYIKKYLHPGEELYFQSSMQYDPSIKLNDGQLSLAICYDIERDEHIECVKNKKSNYYAASIFYTRNGIQSGLNRLQNIAKENALTVLMSNYVGECWGLDAGGCSSIWSHNGELIISADSYSECLVVAENSDKVWKGKIIK